MKITLQHKNITIEVFDAHAFSQTPDNTVLYDKIIQPESVKDNKPVSQHAVIIYQDGVKTFSAVLLAAAGATSVTPDSALLDGDDLIIRCCNTVFSLKLPYLNLNWMTEADWATCFSIHRYRDSYITYGETSITRIDRTGFVLWSFSGADIFVCLDEGIPFKMHENHIALTDFTGRKYKIAYNGRAINS